MKGMFLKDLYSLNVYKKNILLMMAVIIFMSIVMPLGSSYVASMIMVYLVMVLMNLFALDDIAQWNRFAIALPLSRRRIVGVRYLFITALMLAANLVGIGLSAAISLVRGEQGWLVETLLISGSMSLVFLLIASVCIPLCYRFGAEKSRMVIMIVYMVLFLGILWGGPQLLPLAQGLSTATIIWIAAGGAALVLLLFAASFLLSMKIYNKKEF